MDGYIREFALQTLRKLQLRPTALRKHKDADSDIKMNGHRGSSGLSTEASASGSGDGELVDENQENEKEGEHDEEDGHSWTSEHPPFPFFVPFC